MTFMAVLVLGALAQAQTFNVLYNFTGGTDGGYPSDAVVQDTAGNLYGTTGVGGDLNCTFGGCGVVFEVDTSGTETVLHSFTGGTTDGEAPNAPVLRDNKGNLYGTTVSGGGTGCDGYGCGVVFKIDHAGKETILYSFAGGTTDGCGPEQGLVMDKSGNLYGTTFECGASGSGCGGYACGTVFKLTPEGTETILHSFAGGRRMALGRSWDACSLARRATFMA
jgi:uncharacterized repeat protein (TIGR03803 family)